MLGTGSFTQAHGHEPCGLVAHAQHALDLLGGDAFLAGGKEVRSKNPLAERDLGALKNGSDRDAELLAAIVALKQAFAMGLTFKPCRVDRAAMRANRIAGPKLIFEMGAGRIVVVVSLIREVELHDGLLFERGESAVKMRCTVSSSMGIHSTVPRGNARPR